MYGDYNWLIGKIKKLKAEKQNKLTAGEGITITEENVISASGGGGGGAMVVNFVVEDGVLTADTTPTEVKSAMLNTIVVGVINTGEADIPLCACVTGPGGEPQFQIYSPTGDAQVFINVQDDEWALNV